MPRLILICLGLVQCLTGFFGGISITYGAEPIGGEVIAWRELVFETPPHWYRIPEKEGADNTMAVFAAKSDGVLGVVTVSLLDATEEDSGGGLSLLRNLNDQYKTKAGYTEVQLEQQSGVSVLGQKQSPYLTYARSGQRYFVFFPPGSGEKYNINVVLPTAAGQQLPGFVGYFLKRIHTATDWRTAQEKSLAESLQAMQQMRLQLPPVQTSPFLEIESVTQRQWDGAVAAAQQAVAMLYGRLSAEEQKKFDAAWAPMRGYPTQKCVDYLNALNPLLGEFLALRTAINRTSGQLEQAMIEAGWAAELDAESLTRQYLALGARYRNFLYSLQNRMDTVAQDIAALGDPPDAKALMQQAQQHYQRSKDYIRSLGRVETGPEGVWAGYFVPEKGVFGLNNIKKQPILFMIYNTASPEEQPRFRAIYLENDDEASTAWVDEFPLEKLGLLELIGPDTIEGEIADEDDTWPIYAERQSDNEIPVFPGAELELFEEEAAKIIEAAKEKKLLPAPPSMTLQTLRLLLNSSKKILNVLLSI